MNENRISRVEFEVRLYDAGPDGRAKLRTLFNFMQSAADSHSMSLGTSMNIMAEKNLTWVYARFYSEITRFPEMYEKITCETWRSGITDGMVNREFLMSDANGAVFLRSTSSLALIDRDSRKPVVIPDSVINQFEPGRGRAVDYPPFTVEIADDSEYIYTAETRYEDMDVNGHMNNGSYAQMFFESCYNRAPEGGRLKSIDIVFKGEIFYGELIRYGTSDIDKNRLRLYHTAFNEKRGRLSALAVTEWE